MDGINTRMGTDRRAVVTSFRQVPKTAAVHVTTGSDRECRIAAATNIPVDYVPPPEGLELLTVPYKWPNDQDWSRMPKW